MSSSKGIAMVTGAGTGVGRAVTLALLEDGYTVVLTGRREVALDETIGLAGEGSARTMAVPADVSDPKAVEALFAKVKATHGRIDVLFNNAGTNVPSAPVDEITVEQWLSVVNVNLTGVFLCTREAFKMMREQSPRGGRIINNGSISAHTPRPGSAPYTSTKHAITGLTKSTALDGRPFDICCGQIDIGNAETPMTARMAQGVPQANGTMAVEPTMDAAHVGRAVVYMASLPLDANVHTMTVMSTHMPYVGRG